MHYRHWPITKEDGKMKPGAPATMVCPKCGTTIAFSSGTDPDAIVCPKCGWTEASGEKHMAQKAPKPQPSKAPKPQPSKTPKPQPSPTVGHGVWGDGEHDPTKGQPIDRPPIPTPNPAPKQLPPNQPPRTVPAPKGGKTGPADPEMPKNEN